MSASPRAQVRSRWLIVILVALSLASVLAALTLGSYPTSPIAVIASLSAGPGDVIHDIVWHLRAPRAFTAYACGGLLALAGAFLQVLLRNALADPYILGVSGGASLGALLALSAGAGLALMNLSAMTGALAALVIVFGVTFRAGDWNIYRLLLTGVVLSAGFAAAISLVLVLAPDAQVKGMLFWLMGDLSQSTSAAIPLAVLAVLLAGGIAMGLRLDLLALGELKARALGVGVTGVQVGLFAASALATVTAVVVAGSIGFVGLVAPHAVRLAGATHHRALLPLSVLLGGSLLCIADTAARTVWAPLQLPVGIFTALIGVPAMLWLLGRSRT